MDRRTGLSLVADLCRTIAVMTSPPDRWAGPGPAWPGPAIASGRPTGLGGQPSPKQRLPRLVSSPPFREPGCHQGNRPRSASHACVQDLPLSAASGVLGGLFITIAGAIEGFTGETSPTSFALGLSPALATPCSPASTCATAPSPDASACSPTG
jgi:hypothetical protein